LSNGKKLGALSVDEIEKGLQEKSDQLDGNSAEIEFENLEIGSSKTQP